MRKVYTLILALLITGGTTFAQRSIDWSVESFVKPTEILSNTTTGTTFDVEAVLKNNGPDSLKLGDSILYQLAMLSENDAVILAVPGPTSFGVRTKFRPLASGDTMHLHLRFAIGNYPINSLNVKLRLASLILKRGADSVANENTAGQVNNVFVRNMVWWNPQKFGVGIEQITANSYIDLQPNPAVDAVTVNFKIVNVKSSNTVFVYDMEGRLVKQQTSLSGATHENIDVSDLKSGMYTVKVKTGEIESHQKLQVIH